jgi:hypothetical protein
MNTEPTTPTDLGRLPAVHRLAASRSTAELLQGLETHLDALFVHHSIATGRLRAELDERIDGATSGCGHCREGITDLLNRIVEVDTGINRLVELKGSIGLIETDLPEPSVEEVQEAIEGMRETLQEDETEAGE